MIQQRSSRYVWLIRRSGKNLSLSLRIPAAKEPLPARNEKKLDETMNMVLA